MYVVFDDGTAGQANAKTNPPAYKAGDMVGYDVTGQTPRGVSKLKITRNPDTQRGTVTSRGPMDSSNPDLEAATPVSRPLPSQGRPQPQTAPTVQGNIHPATVGMCFKIAADFLLKEGGWTGSTPERMGAMAYHLIQVEQRLERGEYDVESVPF